VLVSAALVVDVLLFSLTTIPGVRPRPGFSTLADGWLQGSAYVLTALLWAIRSHTDRWVPGLVAAALAARALAFVLYLTVVRNLDPVPYPSVADAGWLLMCALLLAALVLLARRSFTYLSANLVLDGISAVWPRARWRSRCCTGRSSTSRRPERRALSSSRTSPIRSPTSCCC